MVRIARTVWEYKTHVLLTELHRRLSGCRLDCPVVYINQHGGRFSAAIVFLCQGLPLSSDISRSLPGIWLERLDLNQQCHWPSDTTFARWRVLHFRHSPIFKKNRTHLHAHRFAALRLWPQSPPVRPVSALSWAGLTQEPDLYTTQSHLNTSLLMVV